MADLRDMRSQHTVLPAWRVRDGQGKWAGVGAPDSQCVPISWTLDWGSHKPCKPAPATTDAAEITRRSYGLACPQACVND